MVLKNKMSSMDKLVCSQICLNKSQTHNFFFHWERDDMNRSEQNTLFPILRN